MTDDLVKRLRERPNRRGNESNDEANERRQNERDEAADRIEALEAALREAYKDCLNAVEKVKSDPFTELGVHHKGKWGDTTARDWMVAFAEDVEREIKTRAALGEKKDG